MRISGLIPDHILRLMNRKDRPKGPSGKTNEELMEARAVESEKELQSQVAALLRIRNIVFDVDRMDKRRGGTVGWPDFTFAIGGKACAIELKRKGGKLSLQQERTIGMMMRNGWSVVVCDNLDAVKRALDEWEE